MYIPVAVDIQKHIDYWRSGAEEDMAAAGSLLEKGHPRHALFFAHLAVEKMVKALVVKATDGVPPKIHDLLRLAELAGLAPSDERREFLAYLQRYCLEGRYPDRRPAAPSGRDAEAVLHRAEEVLEWLSRLLN